MIKIQIKEEEKKISSQEIFGKFAETVKIYQDALENYSEKQFASKKDENTWSLGQMYEHLTASSSFFFMANVIRCLEKRKGQLGGDKNQAGDNVFFYGGFPPRKFEIPESVRPPEIVAKTIEEYKPILEKILIDAQKLIDPIANDEGYYKCIQPAFGWLNAFEWYYLLEMHVRHHLRQKKELESFVGIKL